MATYTINTNAAEEAAIAWAVARVNVQRAADGKPELTKAELLDFFVRQQVTPAAAQMREDEDGAVSAAFKAASQAKRQQAKTVLGLS